MPGMLSVMSPRKRFELGHLVGPQAEVLLDDFGFVVDDRVRNSAPRGQYFHVRVDQLQQVVVAAEDDDVDALSTALTDRAPRTSSASWPSTSNIGICIASSTRGSR